ncbi:hypothetical protein QUF50_00395 [Thiotrichales bacterium HSG1]|nr:hypothetical protein [Thiotrichales bacterium HSG1]
MNYDTQDITDIKRTQHLVSQLSYLSKQKTEEVVHLVSDLKVTYPEKVGSMTAKVSLESDLDPSFSYELIIDHSGKEEPRLVQKFNNELNDKPLYFSEDDKENFISFSEGMTVLKKKVKRQFYQSIDGLESILDKPKPSLLSRFTTFLWEWRVGMSFATSLLVVSITLVYIIPDEPEPIVRGLSASQELVVSYPQVTAQALQVDLTKLGFVATVKPVDKGWMVEVVDLSIGDTDALFVLLDEYGLELPSPGDRSLRILVMVKSGN